ncbi:hypothetical protein VNI00_016114 [Paramarasmius palmivorus]|uniref:Uncharacterized protein n=1 Tax=Paramarasmius palmivorus TaxID=297713 RepID=A0AAW0BGR0_9AGAR
MQASSPTSASGNSPTDSGFRSFLSSNEEKWKFWDSIYAMHTWRPRSRSPSALEILSHLLRRQAESADSDTSDFQEDRSSSPAASDSEQQQLETEDESQEQASPVDGSFPLFYRPHEETEEEAHKRFIDGLRKGLQNPRWWRPEQLENEDTIFSRLEYPYERTSPESEGISRINVTLNDSLLYSVDGIDQGKDAHDAPRSTNWQRPWGFSGSYRHIIRDSEGRRSCITMGFGDGNVICNYSVLPSE